MTGNPQRTPPASGGRDRYEDYVPVAERLEKFYERFPDGRIVTNIIEHDQERGFILMRAEVYRNPDDAQPAATGHAFEVRGESYVNKTSYVENCETGCAGRALALLGFEVKRGLASREESRKRETARLPQPAPKAASQPPASRPEPRNDTPPKQQTPQQKQQPQQGAKGITLGGLHKRINALREQIIGEGAETESVLNEKLGTYGCERVEELDQAQATEYGLWLKDVHEAAF